MKNIELKIRVNDFRGIARSLKTVGAKYQGTLNQNDTYFNCAKGRLKIREINHEHFELIFYERPDKLFNKLSQYYIMPIDRRQLQQFKKMLELSLGIKVIISKKRKLWLLKNTRIHLDTVKTLGKFLELETVLRKTSKIRGENEYLEIYSLLQLSGFEKIKKSYSDLALK